MVGGKNYFPDKPKMLFVSFTMLTFVCTVCTKAVMGKITSYYELK